MIGLIAGGFALMFGLFAVIVILVMLTWGN